MSYITKGRARLRVRPSHRSSTELESEEVVLTATDVAREIGVSRRAEAREAALMPAEARLARRQQRLNARMERVEKSIIGR